MRIWRSLAQPVRVALVINVVLAALAPLGELLDVLLYSQSSPIPEWLYDVLHWASVAWLPLALVAEALLAFGYAMYLLWSKCRRSAVSFSDARADAQQLAQWVAVGLLGECLQVVLWEVWRSGSETSAMLANFFVLASGLGGGASTVALFSALVSTYGLGENRLLRKTTAIMLLAVFIATISARIAFKAHASVDLIFPLLVYLVAQRVIGRRLAEDAHANANA